MNLCTLIGTDFLTETELESESLKAKCRNPTTTMGNDERTVQHEFSTTIFLKVLSFFLGVDWFLWTVDVMYCESVGVFNRFHGVNCMVLVRTPAILVNHTRCMVIWCYMEVLCYCPYCLPGFESILNIEDRWFFSVTFWCATLRMYLRTATFQSKRLAPWLLELWALNSSRCVTSMFWFSKATYTKTAELLMPDWVWLSFSPWISMAGTWGGPRAPIFRDGHVVLWFSQRMRTAWGLALTRTIHAG